uniref:hypothetical protein n=1 Tax=Trichocoleus desertorum TaxID=1481672 RepID=UPI0025B3D8FE|nr:hypothetical protein [Trichocoleus desertorum]
MSQAVLQQILEQLQTLKPSELRQLNVAVQSYLAGKEAAAKRAAFHQSLVVSGLVRQIKLPTSKRKTLQHLIQVQGEPISQKIVEERR